MCVWMSQCLCISIEDYTALDAVLGWGTPNLFFVSVFVLKGDRWKAKSQSQAEFKANAFKSDSGFFFFPV